MKSLFINTSTEKMIIGIVVDDKIEYLCKENKGNDLSATLMPTIEEAFSKTKIKPNDIDTIFVTTGPGSFTGIRMGVTVAKIMAWGLKKKVIPISSLELMASTNTDKEYIVPLIDARRGYVFAGIYDNKLNVIKEDSYISLEELKKEIGNKEVVYVTGDSFDFEVEESDYNIVNVISNHKDDEGINHHKLKPNYLKNTEAEEKRNESRG